MPIDKRIKKVLVIGSGPIVIGQAAEFDYAGAQACRVLRDAGVNVVLVNSNPATIMTDRALADEIYLEPLTEQTLMRIIEKEKPDSLLAGLGGQTGLTLSMQLYKSGFLDAHGVRLIGTNVDAIDRAEDRQLFKDTMEAIGEPVIPSDIACDADTALADCFHRRSYLFMLSHFYFLDMVVFLTHQSFIIQESPDIHFFCHNPFHGIFR